MRSDKASFPVIGFLIAILAFLSTSTAQAGFIMTEEDGTITSIQSGKLRGDTEESGDMWTVIDMSKGTIMMVNPEEKTYSEGTIDEYCAGMRKMMDAMSQFMGGLMPKPSPKKLKVEVVKVGPGGKIAGYDTTHYKVLTDGVLREELWVANIPALTKELGNPATMAKFSQCTEMGGDSYETSKEYQGLMKAGWPLKTVSHEGGGPEKDSEVVRIEKTDIPASKFAAPKGYTRRPLAEAFAPMGE